MKVLIHFGVHRTGSSFIQTNLRANQEVLRSHGFLYPGIQGQADHIHLPYYLAQKNVTREKIVGELESQTSPETHTIIISSENFSSQTGFAYLREIFENHELYAVVYLRRQDLWLESWYNQHVKWPWDSKYSGSSFRYFRKNYREFFWLNYEKLLSRIEQVIPVERLYVNTLDENGLHDTFTDFLQHCEINPDWLEVNKTHHNRSISSARIDLLRRIDINNLEAPARLKILSALRKTKIEEDNGKTRFLTDRQRKDFLKIFSRSNRQVARRYFAREKLFSDYVPDDVKPVFLSDKIAYQKYIPALLKKVAEE
jgi:hypothetical protein